jgi:hypothetical protein
MKTYTERLQHWLIAKRPPNWVDVPRWHHLRAFGNSPVVRATILVPVLGYWILFSEYIYNLIKLREPLTTLWKVYTLYYGLSVLGLGSIIYQLTCPEKVKRYATAVDFALAEREFYERHFEHSGRLIRNARSALSPRDWDRWELKGIYDFTGDNPELDRIKQLTYLWHAQDLQHLNSRLLTGFFFLVGAGLISVPAIWTFYEISRLLLSPLFASR